jgi:hypothetical protein
MAAALRPSAWYFFPDRWQDGAHEAAQPEVVQPVSFPLSQSAHIPPGMTLIPRSLILGILLLLSHLCSWMDRKPY